MTELRIRIEPYGGWYFHWQWTLEQFHEDLDPREDWGKWLPAGDWSRAFESFYGTERTKEKARSSADAALKKYCDQRKAKADRDRAHEEATELIEVKCA